MMSHHFDSPTALQPARLNITESREGYYGSHLHHWLF